MSTHLLCPAGEHARQALSGLRYLLGVDGGGTGTRVKLADRSGKLLGQGEAGPSALGQGSEQAWRHIHQATQAAAEAAGLAGINPAQCAIGLGLSGTGIAAQVESFMAMQPGFLALALDSDGWTTVLGAHGGKPGAVIAAGTGTIGEALRKDGSRACISGWGWVIGDEGSGAWLGMKAMRHAMQVLDGRAAETPLARSIRAIAGQDRAALLDWCAAAGQAGYAGLARTVFETAEAGDAVAAAFIDEAVGELEKQARALDPNAELPLTLSGSIALRLAPRFAPDLRARCVPAQGDSADGALHLVRAALQVQR